MKLGVQVGLGPGHTVLDGDPASPPPKGTAANFLSSDVRFSDLNFSVTTAKSPLVITARSQLRKVLFLALSVTFYLCMKYLGNR